MFEYKYTTDNKTRYRTAIHFFIFAAIAATNSVLFILNSSYDLSDFGEPDFILSQEVFCLKLKLTYSPGIAGGLLSCLSDKKESSRSINFLEDFAYRSATRMTSSVFVGFRIGSSPWRSNS